MRTPWKIIAAFMKTDAPLKFWEVDQSHYLCVCVCMCVCMCMSSAATHLPVVQLNFAAVSRETPFSRDVVEGCVRETLLLLFRALASEQNVFLTLQGIGLLSFKNNKVLVLSFSCRDSHCFPTMTTVSLMSLKGEDEVQQRFYKRHGWDWQAAPSL